jgi:mannosyltransferase
MSSEPPPSPAPSTATAADAAERRFVAPPVDLALVAVTALAVVVGIALRFAPRSGLWLDEALTVNIASLPLGQIGDALRHDGHPPLFYVLLHGWMALGGDSDGWVRALAGVLSVLGLPLTYLAGHRLASRGGAGPLGSRRTGLLALAVMALLPYGVRYGAETRMYSLVITLVLAGYLLVDDLLAGRYRGGRRLLVAGGAALVAGALLWTHYWSMWLLAAVGLLALWRAWKAPTPEQRTGARLTVGALVLGGVLFLPWVPALLYQSANTGTPWGQRFGPASVIVVSIVDFAGARHGAAQLLSYVLVPLVLVATTVRIVSRATMPVRTVEDGQSTRSRVWDSLVIDSAFAPRVRNELLIMALTLGVGWAAAFASNNTFASRYAAVVYPLFVVCVAAGIAVVRQPVVTLVLLASVLTLSFFGDVGEIRFARSQTEPIVNDIVADIEANDVAEPVVIACPDQLGVALQRQVDQQLADGTEVIPYPTAGDPRFVDWVDYGERNTASDPEAFVADLGDRLPADATVYLVASTTYRTFEGKCEQLIATMNRDRDLTQLQSSAPDDHDETADLMVLRPRT